MGEEITITYETLFDLVRREKNREDLQKLDPNFFQDVAAYLKDKISLIEGQKGKMFSETEQEKTMIQIQSIKKLIRELYERRERKIINLALMKARTEGALLDTSSLVEQEQALFNDLNNVILKYRLDLLTTLINPRRHDVSHDHGSTVLETTQAPVAHPEEQFSQRHETDPSEQEESEALETSRSSQDTASFAQQECVTVRFTHAVPAFVGKSLEVYGPFEEDDMAKLPKEIADILMQKGRAESFDGE